MIGDAAELVAGVSPVLEVPFDDAGHVDFTSFDRLVAHLLATGISSAMFPGFASEFYKLSDRERSQLREHFLAQTRSLDTVAAIISITEHATELAKAGAVAAVEAGADVINLLPPHLLSPGRDAVLDHVRAVLAAVAQVPVVLQYAPAQTGISLDANSIASLARAHPNLRLVKVESALPGALIEELRNGTPPLRALVGYGGLEMIDGVNHGAIGVQPGCSFVEIYLEIWGRIQRSDVPGARALHGELLKYISHWMQSVELIIAAEKTISVRRGLIRSAHCRAPSYPLDRHEMRIIDEFLSEFAELLPPPSS